MKVNGYKIREAIRRWTTVQTVAARMFPESTFAFAGDGKDHPNVIDAQYWEASVAVATLQEVQQKFNASITIELFGGKEKMTLSKAIKLVAFAGQRSKFWRTSASETGKSRYSERLMTKSKDDELAHRQVTVKECFVNQSKIDAFLAELRTAIAVANGMEMELDISPELFGYMNNVEQGERKQ